MRRAYEFYDRALGRVSWSFSFLSALAIGVVGVLITGDIIGRALLDTPIRGVVEIAKMSIVAITFLALPFAMRHGGHIRSTVLTSRLPDRVARIFLTVVNLLAAALFALIAHASWSPMWRAWTRGEFEGEGALRVPTAPTRTIIVIASIVMVLEAINVVVRIYRGERVEAESGAELVS